MLWGSSDLARGIRFIATVKHSVLAIQKQMSASGSLTSRGKAERNLTMSIWRLQLLTVLFCVVGMSTCAFNAENQNKSLNAAPTHLPAQVLTLEIPDAPWEPHFFEALEKRTKKAGITSLRQTVLPDHDLEVRFWFDHFEIISGVIIRRSGENWSATYLRQKQDHQPSSAQLEALETPQSGWDVVWSKLTNAGILTLPDAPSINCQSGALDGVGYVVETNVDRKYRTYWYGNPQWADCEEAKQILAIKNIILEEFRLGSLQKPVR